MLPDNETFPIIFKCEYLSWLSDQPSVLSPIKYIVLFAGILIFSEYVVQFLKSSEYYKFGLFPPTFINCKVDSTFAVTHI